MKKGRKNYWYISRSYKCYSHYIKSNVTKIASLIYYKQVQFTQEIFVKFWQGPDGISVKFQLNPSSDLPQTNLIYSGVIH